MESQQRIEWRAKVQEAQRNARPNHAKTIRDLWKEREALVHALRDAWRGDLPIERFAEIGALLRKLGEEASDGK